MVLLGAEAVNGFLRHRLGEASAPFELRTASLLDRSRRVDELHAADHADTWRLVAIHCEQSASAAPDTLSAFASWLSGDGARALIAVEHARSQDPDYTLANLVETTLQAAVSPRVWDGFDISR